MEDCVTMVQNLRRPRLLMRAARQGAADYHRARHIHRIMGQEEHRTGGALILALLEREADLEETRKADGANYSPARHVAVLSALAAETAQLRAARA